MPGSLPKPPQNGRVCLTCNQWKSKENFHREKKRQRLLSHCKPCHSNRAKTYLLRSIAKQRCVHCGKDPHNRD